MNLFRLDASIRADGSASRELADLVEEELRADMAELTVVRRHIGADPVPATAWSDAVAGSWAPAESRTPAQAEAVALAGALVDELEAADAFLFAVPLYNFGVSQHFKTWVDIVVTDPRMGPGGPVAAKGKPGVLATVRGGNYSPGTPREGWDHATDYYRRILAELWGVDLRVVERQFTLVGVNPALDDFKDAAAELHDKALEDARLAGRELAKALSA